MRKPLLADFRSATILLAIVFTNFTLQAQNPKKIDWYNDTISRADAIGGRATYLNTVRGSGQLATERIKLPVDKMKEILDACASHNITDVTVMIVTVRQSDLARLRRTHPEISATGGTIKGRQMLVFKVPRRAFQGAASARVSAPGQNSLMLSLLTAGLVLQDATLLDVPAGEDDYYFSIGSICPPPSSCDD